MDKEQAFEFLCRAAEGISKMILTMIVRCIIRELPVSDIKLKSLCLLRIPAA